ncbi:hypothetical protein JW823_06025 [bacterium]|nr:hypothetical protein [candidate division CSSED10-310 bacterium]
MKRLTLFSAVYIIIWVSSIFSAQEPVPPDNLWLKAVEITSHNEQWTPGYMLSSVIVKDKKGNVLESEDTEMRFFEDASGEIRSEVISGGNNTSASGSSDEKKDQNKKKEEDESEKQEFSINPSDSMFNTGVQDRVTATATTRRQSIGDLQAIAYEFSYRQENGETRKGIAWLHESTGMPLMAEYTLDPLPKHMDAMQTKMQYSTQSVDTWYLVKLEITGSGGFLWIKRQFESHITFSQHFRHQVNRDNPDTE